MNDMVKSMSSLTTAPAGIDSTMMEILNDTAPNGVQVSFPIVIKNSSMPGAGLAMFTKQKIPAGSEILRIDAPLFILASHGCCSSCLHSSASVLTNSGRFRLSMRDATVLQKCSACKVVSYCSRECQRRDWKRVHKYECKRLMKAQGVSLWEGPSRLAFRILCLYTAGQISDEVWALTKSLVADLSHAEGHDLFSPTVKLGHVFMKKVFAESGVTEEEVDELFHKVILNTHSLVTAEILPVALMLHPIAARVNHSCNPSAHYFSDGASFRMRSTMDIPEGGEITITYTQPTYNYKHRQDHLKRHYGFDCRCSRCEIESAAEGKDGALRFDHHPSVAEAQNQMRLIGASALMETVDRSELSSKLTQISLDLSKIAANAVPGMTWPDHLEPIPSLNTAIAEFYLMASDDIGALRTALRTIFVYDTQTFRTPVDDSRTSNIAFLVRVLTKLSKDFQDMTKVMADRGLAELKFMEKEVALLRFFYHHRLVRDGRMAWGADCKYLMALEGLFGNFYGVARPGQVYDVSWFERGTEVERKEEVEAAEARILKWSGVLKPSDGCWFLGAK